MANEDVSAFEKTRAKPDERMAMMMLASILESVEKAVSPVCARLAHDKYAMRGLKAAVTSIRRVIDVAAETIDQDSIDYIVKNSRGYEMVIRQKTVVKDPSWMYVKTDDLQRLIKMATRDECGFCLLDGNQIKACKLRKVLLNMVDEPNSMFGCGFRGGKTEDG